ncbi:hypothetical protein [Shewanella sp. 10N.286.54.B9]|uniref:hypothetical protein n=1 Tax=Shewanella sp. 10N.286.54.B9 TaxID=3229719 RepID=UPI0035541076
MSTPNQIDFICFKRDTVLLTDATIKHKRNLIFLSALSLVLVYLPTFADIDYIGSFLGMRFGTQSDISNPGIKIYHLIFFTSVALIYELVMFKHNYQESIKAFNEVVKPSKNDDRAYWRKTIDLPISTLNEQFKTTEKELFKKLSENSEKFNSLAKTRVEIDNIIEALNADIQPYITKMNNEYRRLSGIQSNCGKVSKESPCSLLSENNAEQLGELANRITRIIEVYSSHEKVQSSELLKELTITSNLTNFYRETEASILSLNSNYEETKNVTTKLIDTIMQSSLDRNKNEFINYKIPRYLSTTALILSALTILYELLPFLIPEIINL